MRILIIAPLPPPITGHSIVSKALADGLSTHHEVDMVNLSKDSLKDGGGLKRILQVAGLLKEINKKNKKADLIYLTISESLAGNLKDLLIYFLCRKQLGKTVIHLHGGSIKRELWDLNQFIFSLNKKFIKDLGGVIISGKSHFPIFNNLIKAERVHILPNFASETLLTTPGVIKEKFLNSEVIRVLYMSNLIEKKGYNELAQGYLLLDKNLQSKIAIDFAGAFDNEREKQAFLDQISKNDHLQYHGIISEDEKRHLFTRSQVFCLPTSYFEGQPISILEAYASGCVVLTTGQPGILDIFENNVNGIQISSRTPHAIKEALEEVFKRRGNLQDIGLKNNILATNRYQKKVYVKGLENIFEKINNKV